MGEHNATMMVRTPRMQQAARDINDVHHFNPKRVSCEAKPRFLANAPGQWRDFTRIQQRI